MSIAAHHAHHAHHAGRTRRARIESSRPLRHARRSDVCARFLAGLLALASACGAHAGESPDEFSPEAWQPEFGLKPSRLDLSPTPVRLGASAYAGSPWWSNIRYEIVPLARDGRTYGDRVPTDASGAVLVIVPEAPLESGGARIGLRARFNGGLTRLSFAPRTNGLRVRLSHDY